MKEISSKFNRTEWKLIRKLSERCNALGGKVYLVGGTVRSAILGEKVEDFDVEVFGLEPMKLENLLADFGRVKKVGKSFGIYKMAGHKIDVGLPRLETKTGTGHRSFAVEIRPDLPVREAALRRDFTMNAIYFDVTREQLVDPLGGLADLENKILRHCSPRFEEDPLRVLRAMQFSARLAATVAQETIALCARLTPESLSAERFYGEWEKLLLSGKQPSWGLRFLQQCNWTRFFPELAAMIGCPQDVRWHPEGDVWTHTLHCLDAYAANRSGNQMDDLIVGLAVLCHDMGKPRTTVVEGSKIHSHGHEKAGLKPAQTFMKRLMVPNRIVEVVLPLIQCHMRPSMLFENKSSNNAVRRLSRDSGRLDLLLRVFQADSAGRPPLPDNSGPAVEWILSESERLQTGNSGPEPLIKGRDLLRRGWTSGPELGKFLTMAYEAQLDGTFTNIQEATRWLDENTGQRGSHPEDRIS